MGQEFEARVLDVREERRVGGDARWQLLLDSGDVAATRLATLEAVSRNGVRLSLPVLRTEPDGDRRVWCVVAKPLAAGTVVRGHCSEASDAAKSTE